VGVLAACWDASAWTWTCPSKYEFEGHCRDRRPERSGERGPDGSGNDVRLAPAPDLGHVPARISGRSGSVLAGSPRRHPWLRSGSPAHVDLPVSVPVPPPDGHRTATSHRAGVAPYSIRRYRRADHLEVGLETAGHRRCPSGSSTASGGVRDFYSGRTPGARPTRTKSCAGSMFSATPKTLVPQGISRCGRFCGWPVCRAAAAVDIVVGSVDRAVDGDPATRPVSAAPPPAQRRVERSDMFAPRGWGLGP
jgi:hypothetical protein